MDNTLLRILKLMKEQHISDTEMQEYLCVPKGTFSNWKRGKGKSYYEYIDRFADRLNVTVDYLVRGEERFDLNCSYNEADLLEKYRLLSVEGKEVVSATIKLLVKIENGKENVG